MLDVVAEDADLNFLLVAVARGNPRRAHDPAQEALHKAFAGDRIVRLPDGRPVGVAVEGLQFPWPTAPVLCGSGTCRKFEGGEILVGVRWLDAPTMKLARTGALTLTDDGYIVLHGDA